MINVLAQVPRPVPVSDRTPSPARLSLHKREEIHAGLVSAPTRTMTDVHVLVDRTTDFSFPSDHATVAGAVAVGLLLANRRWGIVAAFAALVMAFTRVYVGAHYPGDVVAGLALGGAVATAGHYLLVPTLTRLLQRLGPTALRPLVTTARPS